MPEYETCLEEHRSAISLIYKAANHLAAFCSVCDKFLDGLFKCLVCDGSGVTEEEDSDGIAIEDPCWDCDGKGWKPGDEEDE